MYSYGQAPKLNALSPTHQSRVYRRWLFFDANVNSVTLSVNKPIPTGDYQHEAENTSAYDRKDICDARVWFDRPVGAFSVHNATDVRESSG